MDYPNPPNYLGEKLLSTVQGESYPTYYPAVVVEAIELEVLQATTKVTQSPELMVFTITSKIPKKGLVPDPKDETQRVMGNLRGPLLSKFPELETTKKEYLFSQNLALVMNILAPIFFNNKEKIHLKLMSGFDRNQTFYSSAQIWLCDKKTFHTQNKKDDSNASEKREQQERPTR
tara:strand:- start:150 stop:674 length:525 start_codon:yes stop_codon:yes gene_type:complete